MRQFDVIVRSSSNESLAVYLRKQIIEADVTVRAIPLRSYISARNKMILKESGMRAIIAKLIELNPTVMVLKPNDAVVALRTIYEKCFNIARLESDVDNIHSIKNIVDIKNVAVLSEGVLSAIRTLFTQTDNIMYLGSSVVSNSIRTLYAGVPYQSELVTEMKGNGFADKFISTYHKNILNHSVTPLSVKPVGCENDTMQIISSVNKVLFTKYRTLGEMDTDGTTELALQEFDDTTLEDLDYIVF